MGLRRRARGESPAAIVGNLSSGLVFGAASFLSTTGVALFTSIFIGRLYGVTVVGQFAIVSAPVAAVWLLSTVREQPAFQREAAVLPPRHPRVTGLFVAVFTFSTGLTLTVCLLTAGVTYLLLHGPIHHPDLFLPAVVNLAGYVTVTNACWNLDSVFIAFRAGRTLFHLRLHQALVYLVLVIVGRIVSGSVWSLVGTMILSWTFPLLHRLIICHKWLTFRIDRKQVAAGFKTLPEMLSFGIRLTPVGLLSGASNQLGTWVLGSLSSIAVVGAYNRAWSLGQRIQDAQTRFSELLFPTLVARIAENDDNGFNRALIDSIRYSSAFLLLFSSAGGGAAEGVMRVFGRGFARAGPSLAYLLLVPALTTVVIISSQALIARGRALATSRSALVRLIVTAAGVFALSPSMGINGAAVGMAIGAAAQVGWQFAVVQRDVLRLLPAWWPARQRMGQIAAYAAGFLAARVVEHTVPGYAGTAIALAVGALAYLSALGLVGGLQPRDRARLGRLRARVIRLREPRPPSPEPMAVWPRPLAIPVRVLRAPADAPLVTDRDDDREPNS